MEVGKRMDLRGNTDIVWPHQGVEEVTLNNERDGEREKESSIIPT